MGRGKGINGNMYEWLKHFLGKRFNTGVPQGSPISPILFNIYLSDIGKYTNKNISQFGDDLVIWESNKEITYLEEKLNKRLKRLKTYLQSLNLELCPEKCLAAVFNRGTKKTKDINLVIEHKLLKIEKEAKYLGIIFDKKLSWKSHVEEMCKKGKKKVNNLKMLCKNLRIPQKTAIDLYKTTVRPAMEYGSELWVDIPKTRMNKVLSIEQQGLTAALGVNRLSKRSEVNLDACVIPFRVHLKRKLIKTFQRINGTELEYYLMNTGEKRRKLSTKKDFSEKIVKETRKLGICIEEAKH